MLTQNISSYIATISTPAGRRRLQQSLSDVLTQISVVQTAQTQLQSQTSTLQASVRVTDMALEGWKRVS